MPIPQILNEVEKDEVEEVLWVSIKDIHKYEYAFNHLEIIEKFIEENKLNNKFYILIISKLWKLMNYIF